MTGTLEQPSAAALAAAANHSAWKHWAYGTVAFAVAGALLYFSLRGIAWPEVLRTLETAHWRYLAFALTSALTSLVLRSVRWRLLLRSESEATLATTFLAMSAGYLGNNVLPGRAGELVRLFHIHRRTGASKTFVLTTIACERISDAVALVIIAAGALVAMPATPGWLSHAVVPFAGAGFCGLAAIAVAARLDGLSKGLLERLPQRIRGVVSQVVASVVAGTRPFRQAKRLAAFVALTAVIWVVDGITALLYGASLGLALTLPITMLLNSALGLGSAIPSTPGYVGIYQFVAISVLAPFGVARSAALAYILVVQACSYLLLIVCGTMGLADFRKHAERR